MVTREWMTRRYRFPCPRREKYERGGREKERERFAVYPESAFSDSCTNGETERDVKLARL